MAVTRDGIPVRVWCWPGNTGDQALIRQVKDDMRDWTLSKIVWVADRGFSSDHNRRYLRQGDHAYIVGEKLRSDSPQIKAALSRQGRYTDIAENMRVKEVKVSDTERFVICHNPDAAQARRPHPRAVGRPTRGADHRVRQPAGDETRARIPAARPAASTRPERAAARPEGGVVAVSAVPRPCRAGGAVIDPSVWVALARAMFARPQGLRDHDGGRPATPRPR